MRCHAPGCRWQAVAPSPAAAREQYLRHLADEHVREVDAELPDGMVQVRFDADDEWLTVPPEAARRLHDARYGDGVDPEADLPCED